MGIPPKDFWDLSWRELDAVFEGWEDEQFHRRIEIAKLEYASAGGWSKTTDMLSFLSVDDRRRVRDLRGQAGKGRKVYTGTPLEQIEAYRRDREAAKNGNGAHAP